MQSKVTSDNQLRKTDKLVKQNNSKTWIVLFVLGIFFLICGVVLLVLFLNRGQEIKNSYNFPRIPSEKSEETYYSVLTGDPIADEGQNSLPTYCIQTPNGTDGARPQVGLNQAGVIFEAIAEMGITRFAAIYQNPTSAVIGPIRSLRMYYLDWDTPFNCTIVHAGGADDALAAVSRGGYRDLTENNTYMYRGTNGNRLWNNLFTTSDLLKQFNADNGYSTSNVEGFDRMLPAESKKQMIDNLAVNRLSITAPTNRSTSELIPKVATINLSFGNVPSFNVQYKYDASSNRYLRSYMNGSAHEVYTCPNENLGEINPEGTCSLTQMAPSVVVAMVVSERRASDNYHEDITSIGSGNAYIFQNGDAIKATWQKKTKQDQIKFLDEEGREIKLAPGQTFISAIPNYGNIEY